MFPLDQWSLLPNSVEAGRNLPGPVVTIFAFCFSAATSGLKIYYRALDFIFPLQFFNNLVLALLVYFS